MNTHLNITLAPFDRYPTQEQLDHLIYVDMIEPRRSMSSELRGAMIYCACMSERYGFPAASILQQKTNDDGSWPVTLVVLAMTEDGRLFSASYDEAGMPKPIDYWPTPEKAVRGLIPHPGTKLTYAKPCAGRGDLMKHLQHLDWVQAFDASPHACAITPPGLPRIEVGDARRDPISADAVLTDPPFDTDHLLPMMRHWQAQGVTQWLLLPATRIINLYFAPFAGDVTQLVPIRRLKWIDGSRHQGTKDFVWVKLEPGASSGFLAARPAA